MMPPTCVYVRVSVSWGEHSSWSAGVCLVSKHLQDPGGSGGGSGRGGRVRHETVAAVRGSAH